MTVLLRTPKGVRCTDLGAMWAVFSPLSGQTLMLNTEAVAILEVLRDQPGGLTDVCRALAADGERDARELEALCQDSLALLLDAGLLEPASGGVTIPT